VIKIYSPHKESILKEVSYYLEFQNHCVLCHSITFLCWSPAFSWHWAQEILE